MASATFFWDALGQAVSLGALLGCVVALYNSWKPTGR